MLDWLYDFFCRFWCVLKDLFWWTLDALLKPFGWLLDGFFSVLVALAYAVFDGFLITVLLIFQSFDVSALVFSYAADLVGAPDLMVWFIVQLGIAQCFSMIAIALGIRKLLDLLPASVTRI